MQKPITPPLPQLNALISLLSAPFGLTEAQAGLPSTLPVDCRDVKNLLVFSGQYTPNDDIKVIGSGLSLVSPNFIFLVCDSLANLTSNNAMFSQLPVVKTLFSALSPLAGGASPIDSLSLDGRVTAPYPMLQGKLVNYSLIVAQAVIL